MAINLTYNAPYALAGQAALQAGQGQYALAQQDQALREAQLAEQQRQFNESQSLRAQMAQLQDIQQRRSLGANMANAAAGREAQYANNQLDAQQAMYLAELQQQGYADMRESDEAMKMADRASREKIQLSQEQNRIKQHYQDQQFNTAMASAKALEQAKQTLSPEQYQQARAQWDQQFGESTGDYPFVAPANSDAPPVTAATVKQSMQSMLGTAYMDGMEGFMGHEENGQWVWDVEPAQRAQIALGLKKDEADRIKSEQVEANKIRAAEQKAQQDAEKAARDLELNTKKAREDFRTKVMMEALKPQTVTNADGEKTTSIRSMQEVRSFVAEMMAEYDSAGGAPQSTSPPSGPVQISSAAEYESLPSGTEYIDPNGVRRRKP